MLHSSCVAAYFHVCILHSSMLESYAGSHVCISRVSQAGHARVGFQTKTFWCSRLCFGRWVDFPVPYKKISWENCGHLNPNWTDVYDCDLGKYGKETMDIREFEDNWNKKLAYSGRRLEEMEKDYTGSQGPQQTLKWTDELEKGEYSRTYNGKSKGKGSLWIKWEMW